MSDYTNSYGGAAKDTAEDIILGADIDTQLDNVASMSATKADKVSSATNNDVATLDSNGNLKDGGETIAQIKTAVINTIYPVGSVYYSTVSTNPNTLFGVGTWTRIAQGRTIIGEGTGSGLTARTAGATGGSEDAVLIQHTHTLTDPGHDHSYTSGGPLNGGSGSSVPGSSQSHTTGSTTTGITVDNAGTGSGTDENMQPYLVTYIWERTA